MKPPSSFAATVTVKVVDASAVVALLFNELTRDAVVPRLRNAALYSPELLGFEVANACLKKIRAYPGERETLLQAFSIFFELDIELAPVSLADVIALARETNLSVYDASYLWLADTLGAELVTLDEKLAKASTKTRASTTK
jgi:predicted nucleic acid-binding protein